MSIVMSLIVAVVVCKCLNNMKILNLVKMYIIHFINKIEEKFKEIFKIQFF